MSEFSLSIDYCSELDALADLLAGISRGGDFAASGALTSILPGVIVDGVGRIAFPLLPEQAKKIASVADQAPYGRGEETLIDRDIRDVLQIEPGRFQLLGETWDTTLRKIVGSVAQGLGCEDVEIKAELSSYYFIRLAASFPVTETLRRHPECLRPSSFACHRSTTVGS